MHVASEVATGELSLPNQLPLYMVSLQPHNLSFWLSGRQRSFPTPNVKSLQREACQSAAFRLIHDLCLCCSSNLSFKHLPSCGSSLFHCADANSNKHQAGSRSC